MALEVSSSTLESLRSQLLNTSGATPLHSRFRALFTLKSLASPSAPDATQTSFVVDTIGSGFHNDTCSALLRHELAYVLGQIGSPLAIPTLEEVLSDVENQEEMVRHEAAEALAALSSQGSVELLKKFATAPGRGGNDDGRVVRETCEIALAKIEWDATEEAKRSQGADRQFTSVDPAPPFLGESHSPLVKNGPNSNAEVPTLRATLLDTSIPLFTRYRAMFALRNIGTPEAIDALCAGFDDDSALFKHEIAFILGQLSDPHSIPALMVVLKNESESSMVRHEAAEALGGIPTFSTSEKDETGVVEILREWSKKKDAPDVVRDSCVVAVDMWEYENSNQFQYADGLEQKTESTPVSFVVA